MNGSKSRKVFKTTCKVLEAAAPSKGRRAIFPRLLVVLLLANTRAQGQAPAEVRSRGQIGNWQAAESLVPGTRVSVKTEHRYRCAVEAVTEEELICEAHVPRSFRRNTLVIRRSQIREVRILPHPNHTKDAWIGAGMGRVPARSWLEPTADPTPACRRFSEAWPEPCPAPWWAGRLRFFGSFSSAASSSTRDRSCG